MARALIAEIKAEDEDDELESYLEYVFDHFGLDIEETTLKCGYFIIPGERMTLDIMLEGQEGTTGFVG